MLSRRRGAIDAGGIIAEGIEEIEGARGDGNWTRAGGCSALAKLSYLVGVASVCTDEKRHSRLA